MTKHRLEQIVLWLFSAVCVGISVAHLTGLLESHTWVVSHIPTFSLLLIAGIVPPLVAIIEGRAREMYNALDEIRRNQDADIVERFEDVRKRLDKDLEAVFGDHIAEMLAGVAKAMKEKTVELHDIDLFRSFYRRTLLVFPGSTILATSRPTSRYFWRNQHMERAMAKFIDAGGHMKRIFFLSSNDELHDAEVISILDAQVAMKIEVYVVEWERIPRHLRRFFAVESTARLGWEVTVGPHGDIEHMWATCDQTTTRRYLHYFAEILGLDTTTEYYGSAKHRASGA